MALVYQFKGRQPVPGWKRWRLAIVLGLTALLAPLPVAGESQLPPLKQLIDELRATPTVAERVDLCHEYLRSGRLSRKQTAPVYGILGSINYEIAIEILHEAKDQGGLSLAREKDVLAALNESIRHYNTSLAINPDYYLNYWHRGYTYETGGSLEKALEDYTQTVDRDPAFAPGYIYRARVLHKLGRREEAVRDLHKALELEPEDAHAALAKEMLEALKAAH